MFNQVNCNCNYQLRTGLGFLPENSSLQESMHLALAWTHLKVARDEPFMSLNGHLATPAKQSKKIFSHSSRHSSKSKFPFLLRLFLPPSTDDAPRKTTSRSCWENSIQFNFFKTHNIKKQAIQIKIIIISHMVPMKFN
jgi:hypothetical protein